MISPFFILLKKEFHQELKSRDALLSMTIFGISIILIFSFAFNPVSNAMENVLPGLVWITFMFSLNIGISRNFAREKDLNAINVLLNSPIDRGYVFLSKSFAFIFYLLLSQVILFPLFHLFLGFTIITNWKFWILSMSINWAISTLGIVVGGLGFRSKMGDVLSALLFFPLSTPVLIAAVKSTSIMTRELKFEFYSFWVMIILSFAVGMTILGLFLFDHSLEE